MALKLPFPFPIFAPPSNPNPNAPPPHRPPTVIRFSRWNNANAEKFNRRQRAQQEIEDDIRRERRFDSATKIANICDSATTSPTAAATETFKSIGTPSLPSNPSIPGRKSKYSKNPNSDSHPAFRKISRITKHSNVPKVQPLSNPKANVSIGEDGVSYVIDGAPFEFKYSYTEAPKVKPLKLREPPYTPFGPTTMARPWTGRAPLPPSKKKLKEFDSFQLPPPYKKGVKPVQKPGPFLPGTGPKYVYSREEILGEPLTEEEVKELVNSSIKSRRQLNMGRDGLTHNMLDNIHALWKRRRVCKVKCKGVCTVDMDNVCQQLEERTGGKIIYKKGGVLYLFRGRNYNYKTRPRFPLMLWKPVTPVYPRLIQQVPEGLTLEEASEMRKKGRKLIPICKLGKNGLYSDLVNNVREAFEECELVRINCQGMNGSDYRKIGAKLKDLVPCVLISFEYEHILTWRGRDWKFSLPKLKDNSEQAEDSANSITASLDDQELSAPRIQMVSDKNASLDSLNNCTSSLGSENMHIEQREDLSSVENDKPYVATDAISTGRETFKSETTSDNTGFSDDESETTGNTCGSACISDNVESDYDKADTVGNNTYRGEIMLDNIDHADEDPAAILMGSDTMPRGIESIGNHSESSIVDSINCEKLQDVSKASADLGESERLSAASKERVLLLMKQAIESGSAVVLDDATLDADNIYQRAAVFAQSAPPGPVFRRRPRKVAIQKIEKQESGELEGKQESGELEGKQVITISKKRGRERQTPKIQRKGLDEHRLDVVPQGSLRVDELAKLLS